MTAYVMLKSNFPHLGEPKRGKVRDIYDLGSHLLMVVTDRISAFDVVMNEGIPQKGEVLNSISNFWFRHVEHIIPNHIVSTDSNEYAKYCPGPEYAEALMLYRSALRDRSTLVKKVNPLPVEAIVRGYISGSGWKSYCRDGTVCGIPLPAGLRESDKLPEPTFTPSTKAEEGQHDENISYEAMEGILGAGLAKQVKEVSLEIYQTCADIANEVGIIIADTKFEFGLDENGELILIDEVLTPDSSRFWPADTYRPGEGQPSLDKQPLRDWLEIQDWDKTPPPPPLPDWLVQHTSEIYRQAFTAIQTIRDL